MKSQEQAALNISWTHIGSGVHLDHPQTVMELLSLIHI